MDCNLAIEERALVPAFELDMSSVIFASTASAATSVGGALSTNDAFTLRYGMDRKVSALVSYDKSKVTLSGVWAGIYLVVQNKDVANAKRIIMQKEVSATDMGVDTFANCKVWLEYTDYGERKTYATLATEEQGYDVNITASDGLTVTNGVQGVAQGSAITNITVAVADGYYLPDGYTNNIQGLNGLNVKDVTQTGFTISGTPTNDVNIVLPEARRDQFVVEGGTKGVDYTYQNGVLTFVKGGNYVLKHPPGITDTSDRVVIANSFNGTLTLDNISINLNGVPCIDVASDANLTLIIKSKNKLGVHDGDPAAIQFMNVAENGSLTIDSEEPVGELTLHGRNGPGLGSPGYNSAYTKNIYINGGIIDASSDNGIGIGSYSDSNASEITINGGTIKGGKIGSNYKGSKVIINGGYIQNSINVETEINGGFVKGNIEENEIKNCNGDVVYKTNIALESDYVKSLKVDDIVYNFPTQPGGKDISVYLPQGEHTVTHEDNDGKAYEYKVIINKDGTVKNVNTWAEKLSIKGWKYGETANTPTAKAKFGSVTYTYSDKENGTYTSDVPSNAGTYYVKATVTETENYTGLESVVSFEILKADPFLKALDTLTIEEGKSLSNLGLPEGYKWKNPNYECKDLGSHTYKAVFTPKDSVNYNTLDVDVSVNVIAKTEVNNPTPSVDSNVTTNSNNNNNNSYVGNGGSTTSNVLLDELKEVVNKSEYKAYEKAYTKESYDNYLDAFENAEKVLNNKNSSKEEIKVALDKLNEAISNLKVDKTNLESSLVEFEKLDADKYSEASYIKLKDTLDKAKSVMEDKEASAEEIARAIDELNEAYSSLQAVEPTVTEPEKTSVGKLALITTVATVTVVGGGSYLWILLKRFRGMK